MYFPGDDFLSCPRFSCDQDSGGGRSDLPDQLLYMGDLGTFTDERTLVLLTGFGILHNAAQI